MTRIASIDAGTNSTRLLLAEVEGEPRAAALPRLRTLERRMVITRMGRATDASGRLSSDGLERTRRVLQDYARVIEEKGGADALTVAGTSAARDAANASDFGDMVLNIFGVSPRVISGEEEARLSYAGATYDLPETRQAREALKPVLVVDIGGGSTEFVLGRGSDLLYQRSVDVGCVRMSERFLVSDPPAVEEIAAMRAEIARVLEPVFAGLRGESIDLLVGLAGTVTTLSGMRLGLREYDGEVVHGSQLARDDVLYMFREMAGRGLEERRVYMGLEPERADVILGGTAVLENILLGLGKENLLVSEKDILDGMVIEAWLDGT